MDLTLDTPETQAGPTLGFGKFADRPLPFLPLPYLMWVLPKLQSARLRRLVQLELDRRAARAAGPATRPRLGSSPMAGHVILPPPDGECPF